ncbi:carbohydrate kinase family protein [Streptomyces sp. NPDC004647]|uniref:carbohydrate kinase family protein n=1 Tax=Streptomyces sp. NPDC004647 TaxID=3154671 RepID=UPI0033A29B2C
MRVAVSGSIATDHLMAFPGRFTDQLIAGELDHVSLSFLVDDLQVRRGGAGANIAFGLGQLGLAPVLVGAAGGDFTEYQLRLKEHGVDTDQVHISRQRPTARFMCLTDQRMNRIATFYAGAMSEARDISIRRVAERCGGLDLVLISRGDPEAMLRHTADCRDLGLAFAADPSQQIARLEGPQIRSLVTGARWLFTNEYEAALLLERTGWQPAEVLGQVGTWVTTLGAAGVRIDEDGRPPCRIRAVTPHKTGDPTGAGDAFRAGFLAGVGRHLPPEGAAQLGCALATTALEAMGPQEYQVTTGALLAGIQAAYGSEAAHRIAPRLEHLP